MIRAVIDVGTNSVKLLVAKVEGNSVFPLLEQSEQTRLGRGFYETHRLQPEAIAQTAQAAAKFYKLAQDHQSDSVRIIATSAARDATNRDELVRSLESTSGGKVEVISGEQEAEWVFEGVCTDPKLSCQSALVLDVGGGSTEFILGRDGHHFFCRSFSIGSVRLMEKLAHSDPPSSSELQSARKWLKEFFQREVHPQVAPVVGRGESFELVGTGGTSTILARIHRSLTTFERDQIEGTRLRFDHLQKHLERLWKLSLAERKKVVGLPPNRADIILMGLLIYEAVMAEFNFPELYISTRGLRFGAVLT